MKNCELGYVILSVCILLSFVGGIPAYAEQEYNNTEIIEEPYVYISIVNATLSINNGVASCKLEMDTDESAKQIQATMTLQKKNGNSWEKVCSWTDSAYNKDYLKLSETYGITKGTYRVHGTVKITAYSGSTEYAYPTSGSKTY